jgi:hypothetical protein
MIMPIYLMTPLKSFLATEAERNDVCPRTVHDWVKARCYGWLVFHRQSKRRIFVTGTTLPFTIRPTRTLRVRYSEPPPHAVQFKTWLGDKARELGIERHTLYMRIKRGKHPAPTMFRGGRSRDEYVIP